MIRFVVDWFVLTLSVGLAAWFIPEVRIDSLSALFWAGTALGLANLLLRPLLNLVTLPLRFLTLGLVSLLVNGVVFFVAAALVPGFSVGKDLWTATLAALFVGIVSWILGDLGYRRQRKKWSETGRTRSVSPPPTEG
ncbi:MAG: phage holin family protein [Myxococcota bacterium]